MTNAKTAPLDRPAEDGARKWIVCVYGKLPDQIEIIGAKDRATAEEAALEMILEDIEFCGHSDE